MKTSPDPLEELRQKVHQYIADEKFAACCSTLEKMLITKCPAHGYDCPDKLVNIGLTAPLDNPQAIWFGHAPNASYEINFCPFCGNRLSFLNIS